MFFRQKRRNATSVSAHRAETDEGEPNGLHFATMESPAAALGVGANASRAESATMLMRYCTLGAE